MPSSRKPSMHQVLTNSSTCLGWSVICVSRSLPWMTFTPSFMASRLKVWSFDQLAEFFGFAAGDLLVVEHLLGDVEKTLLDPMRDQTGVGAMLDHRRRTRLAPAGRHVADVHVPPVKRALGGVLFHGHRCRGPKSQPTYSRTAPRDRGTIAKSRSSRCSRPDRSASRRPRRIFASSAPRFSGVIRVGGRSGVPWAVQGLSTSERSSKSRTVMFSGGMRKCRSKIGSVHCATAP